MKLEKIALIPIFLFGLTLSFNVLSQNADNAAAAVAEPTMIQLKTMQERKFKKPYEEVIEGISSSVGYTSGKCSGTGEPGVSARGRATKGKVVCYYSPKVPQVRSGFGLGSMLAFVPVVGAIASVAQSAMTLADMDKQAEEARTRISQIDFELSFPKQGDKYNENETLVKMIMYQGQGNVVKIADLYSENFKKLADAIFVEALEISAAEQQ